MNWGPKPFKVFSYWYEHPDFVSLVKIVWNGSSVQGNHFFRFKEKLRMIKDILRGWNGEVFGVLDFNVEEAIKELNSLDHQMDIEGECTSYVISKMWVEATTRVWQTIQHNESMLRQKSRVRWIREVD